MQRMGATPGKLALVGVLALVLVTVIVGQLPDSKDNPQLALRPRTPLLNQPDHPTAPNQLQNIQQRSNPSQPKTTHSNSSTNSREQSSKPITWPNLSLETIVAFDPFAAPTWLTNARTAAHDGSLMTEATSRTQKAEVLRKLQEQGTTIVVISAEDKQATIGEQTVRIGDYIEGFVITDITKQGVVIKEK